MWFNKSQFHSFPDEPIVPTMSKGRRGTVFAEAYNPEDDDEDDVKVNHNSHPSQKESMN